MSNDETRLRIALADLASGSSELALRMASGGKRPVAVPTTMATLLAQVLTTRGDLLRRGSSAPERLAVGTVRQVLGSDGTDAAWRDQQVKYLETLTTGGTTVAIASTLAVGKLYLLYIYQLDMSADSILRLRTARSAGSYDSDVSDYAWSSFTFGSGGSAAAGDNEDSEIHLGNQTWEGTSGHLGGFVVFGQQSGQQWRCAWLLGGLSSAAVHATDVGTGRRLDANSGTDPVVSIDLDGLSGDISSLKATLWEIGEA